MKTQTLMLDLSKQEDKAKYLNLLDNELKEVIHQLKMLNYNITIDQGLKGEPHLNEESFNLYQYFRIVQFIYFGLRFERWQNDPIDEQFFKNLKELVTTQYTNLI
jgi:hypothetical protein